MAVSNSFVTVPDLQTTTSKKLGLNSRLGSVSDKDISKGDEITLRWTQQELENLGHCNFEWLCTGGHMTALIGAVLLTLSKG